MRLKVNVTKLSFITKRPFPCPEMYTDNPESYIYGQAIKV